MHFNAYFYGEMTFILVNGETSKRQEKQLFADWRPVNETIEETGEEDEFPRPLPQSPLVFSPSFSRFLFGSRSTI